MMVTYSSSFVVLSRAGEGFFFSTKVELKARVPPEISEAISFRKKGILVASMEAMQWPKHALS